MAINRLFFIFIICVNTFFFGCASYNSETKEVRSYYYKNQFKTSLDKLEKSDVKDQKKNRLLYRLEKAQILDRLGETKKSRKYFMDADKIADELYTESIGKNIASFVLNDSTTDYEGEDYEIVGIHIALAMSFIEDNEFSSSLVEARKINSKINEINNRYSKNKNIYKEDAFARYLSGMIHESDGNLDSAIVDYAKALDTYENSYRKNFNLSAPDSLVRALYSLYKKRNRGGSIAKLKKKYPKLTNIDQNLTKKEGEIIVIHEEGVVAPKTNSEHLMPWGGKIMRFSFPKIDLKKRHRYSIGKTGIKFVSSGVWQSGEKSQDMNSIASVSLNDRKTRVFFKSLSRLVVKDQLSQKANKEYGPLAGLLISIFGAVTETGDTRSWSLMPARYHITRKKVPVGIHEIQVFTAGSSVSRKKIKIRNNEIVILRAK